MCRRKKIDKSGEQMLVGSVHNEDLSSKNKVIIQEVGGATGSEPSDLPPYGKVGLISRPCNHQ